MKRVIALVLLAFILVLSASACSTAPKTEDEQQVPTNADSTPNAAEQTEQASAHKEWPKMVTIATGSSGGTNYYIGAAQTQILNNAIDGVEFVAESTDSSPTTNGPIVQNNPDCLGIIAVVAMQEAINGTYEEMPGVSLDKARLIMVGNSTMLQFVTLKETGITSLDQLKGKRVATANPGTVVRLGSLQVLKEMGYEDSDFASLTALSPADMGDALKDGSIDMAIINGGTYNAALADLNSTRDIVMLQVPLDVLDKVIEEHPGYITDTVNGEIYSDLTEDFTILGMPMALWCNADMGEELVYEITKVLNESTDELAAAHTNGIDWNTENTLTFYNDGSIPFHPGAARYYDEIQGK